MKTAPVLGVVPKKFPADKHFFVDGGRLARRLYVAASIMVDFGCFWLAIGGCRYAREPLDLQSTDVRSTTRHFAMNKKFDRGRKK